jgi:hypothetical protein
MRGRDAPSAISRDSGRDSSTSLRGGCRRYDLGAKFPEDLAEHALEELGVFPVQVEAVEEAAGLGFGEFGRSFGEVAAGSERVEECGGEAL